MHIATAGSPLSMGVRHQQVFAGHPSLDIRAALIPVVRIVFGDRLGVADRQSACGTGVYELLQVGVQGRIKNVPQALDIRAEQRRRVTQPHPGIDDAVVDDVAARHRRPQGSVIKHIPITALDIEIVDPFGGTGAAQHDSHIGARSDKLPRDM